MAVGLVVIPDVLLGLWFGPALSKLCKGLSGHSSPGPQREPPGFAQLLTRTHSPSTSRPLVHSVSPKQPVPQCEFIPLPKMHLEHPDGGKSPGSAFAFAEGVSVNQIPSTGDLEEVTLEEDTFFLQSAFLH